MPKLSRHTFTLIMIIFSAAALRLGAALIYGDMWYDELFHIVYSDIARWSQTWHFLTLETNPPLFTILIKLWRLITPEHELWYRLPNIIIGTGTVYAVYAFSKKLFSSHTALYAAGIMAVYPYHIFMSATIRGYALLMLLTVLSSYYLYSGFLNPNPPATKKRQNFYTIFTTLLLYTHIIAIGVLITHGIIIFLRKTSRVPWVYSGIISLAFFSVWLMPWIYNRMLYRVNDGWFLYMHNAKKCIAMVAHLFTGTTHPIHYLSTAFLFVCGLAILLIKENRQKSNLNFLFLLWGIPMFGALMISLWHIKFISVIVPFTAILIAYMITNLVQRESWRLTILIVIYLPSLVLMYTSWLPLQSWDLVNTYIATQTNTHKKQIILDDDILRLHEKQQYYTGTIPYLVYLEPLNLDIDTHYITQNYRFYRRTDAEIDAWIKKNNVSMYDEIFILENKQNQIPIRERLIQQGWHVVGISDTKLMNGARLVFMQK